jgi:hypothetical protein
VARYKIIKSELHQSMYALVWRWWWPFWTPIKGYSTLYGDEARALDWCRKAISNHKAGLPLDPPEWSEVE